MTNEEAQIVIGNIPLKPEVLDDCYSITEYQEAKAMAIEALEQQPCEDAISRQAVDILVDELARAISDERCCISRGRSTATIMQDILDLPSVTPQPKIGHWIDMGDFEKCSVCNGTHLKEFQNFYGKGIWVKTNYCPNCGADIRGEVPITKRIECGTDGNLYEMSITNGKEYENTMREATPEELESVNNYIKSISKPTGVNIWDEIEEVTTDADGS